jgi:hypothetical protein
LGRGARVGIKCVKWTRIVVIRGRQIREMKQRECENVRDVGGAKRVSKGYAAVVGLCRSGGRRTRNRNEQMEMEMYE